MNSCVEDLVVMSAVLRTNVSLDLSVSFANLDTNIKQ